MGWVAYKLANIQVKRESIKQVGKSYKIKQKNYIVVYVWYSVSPSRTCANNGAKLLFGPFAIILLHRFFFFTLFFFSFFLLSLVSTSRVISYILSLRRRVSCYITEAFSRRLFLSPQILILLSLSYIYTVYDNYQISIVTFLDPARVPEFSSVFHFAQVYFPEMCLQKCCVLILIHDGMCESYKWQLDDFFSFFTLQLSGFSKHYENIFTSFFLFLLFSYISSWFRRSAPAKYYLRNC